jgi:hypothetical protein
MSLQRHLQAAHAAQEGSTSEVELEESGHIEQ